VTTCSRWFLARGFVYPEDEGLTFLRNVGSHKILLAPHPRRRHSSKINLAKTWRQVVSFRPHNFIRGERAHGCPASLRVWHPFILHPTPFDPVSELFVGNSGANITAISCRISATLGRGMVCHKVILVDQIPNMEGINHPVLCGISLDLE
jgi:hypothetical protein